MASDANVDHYVRIFTGQSGGNSFPFYSGAPYGPHYLGVGIGNWLSGAWRKIFPVVRRVAGTFLNSFNEESDKGATMKDAAITSFNPALRSAVRETLEEFRRAQVASDLNKEKDKSVVNAINEASEQKGSGFPISVNPMALVKKVYKRRKGSKKGKKSKKSKLISNYHTNF